MRALLLGFAILSLFAAPAAAQARAIEVRDDVGHTLHLAKEPQRIVSLAPELTELVAALGASAQLAAQSDDCDEPAALRDLPRVGPYFSPNLERIVAQRPDLVLASGRGTPIALVARLNELGIPVYTYYPRSLSTFLSAVERAANAIGREREGATLLASLRADWEASAAKPGAQRPSVAWLFSLDPLYTSGPGTLSDDMLAHVGARNAYADSALRYPQIGAESLLARQPDLILIAAPPKAASAEARATLAAYPLIAAKRGLMLDVDANLFSRAGPRLGRALRELARLAARARAAGATP